MKSLSTDRLELLPFTLDDAPFILKLLNTPSWIKFIGDRGVKDVEEAKQYIKNNIQPSYAKKGYGAYLVRLKTKDIPIGLCGLFKRNYLRHPDIGFAFLSEYTGQGFAYEAAIAVMNHAKEMGFHRIMAFTTTENERSILLLKKLGLEYEKHIKIPNDEEVLLLFGTPIHQSK